jgi:CTP:molybdopterin cytidylyltransferase MocA
MIDAIILAAGLGTRMGATKPLTPIGDEPALATVLRRIADAGIDRPIVVLGASSAGEIEDAIDLSQCTVVRNDAPEAGMGRSLRLGLDAVSREARGVLVLHADMPFVRIETIRAVLSAASGDTPIVAPSHEGRRGFPVFFHRSRIPGLREVLSGDAGGRAYIAAHRHDLTEVPVDDPGCIYDIDRPADVAAWEGEHACSTNA